MSAATAPPAGLLLVHGAADVAARWAALGLTAAGVAPLAGGWTAIVPTRPVSAATAPYDDAGTVLLNRPLPGRLRPALGLMVVHGNAVVAVSPARWRSIRRWLTWHPGTGLVHPGGLPVARLADLVRVARADDPAALAALADVVHDPAGDAHLVLHDLLTVLDLPGGDLLDGSAVVADLPGARLVEPRPGRVAAFERMVREETSWRDEMEGQSR